MVAVLTIHSEAGEKMARYFQYRDWGSAGQTATPLCKLASKCAVTTGRGSTNDELMRHVSSPFSSDAGNMTVSLYPIMFSSLPSIVSFDLPPKDSSCLYESMLAIIRLFSCTTGRLKLLGSGPLCLPSAPTRTLIHRVRRSLAHLSVTQSSVPRPGLSFFRLWKHGGVPYRTCYRLARFHNLHSAGDTIQKTPGRMASGGDEQRPAILDLRITDDCFLIKLASPPLGYKR